MKAIENAKQLKSRAIGAMIFAGFGGVWVALALYAKERLNFPSIAGVALVLCGMQLAGVSLIRHSRRLPTVADDPRRNRQFHVVNALQWIAAFIVANILANLHLNAYIVPAIAGIVGLHLFPLARVFGDRQHYVTGSLLISWAAGASLLVPANSLPGTAALGAGTILWLSAAVTLVLAYEATRQSSSASPAQQTV